VPVASNSHEHHIARVCHAKRESLVRMGQHRLPVVTAARTAPKPAKSEFFWGYIKDIGKRHPKEDVSRQEPTA
jgi:hypothetical protein